MLGRVINELDSLVALALVSMLFGLAKLMVLPEKIGVRAALASIFMSVLVGTLVGSVAFAYGAGDAVSMMASSIAALVSRDILTGIVNNRDYIGGLFKRAVENLVDKFTK